MTNLDKVMDIFSDILTKRRKEPNLGQLLGVETKPSLSQRVKDYAKKKVDEEGVGWVYPTVGRHAKKAGGKVLDYFVGEMEKSRFEQQPVKGNFLPRPDPKKNTTEENEDETSVILAKESPIQGPGIPTKDSEPSEEVVGKGKKAAHSHEVDASVPDNSTYVVGMMKERFGRQYSRAKKAAKSHQRDLGQSAMYNRQESLLDAPSELEEMKERHGARMTGKLATDPRGKTEIKRHRRQANKLLDSAAGLQAKPISTRRREKAMPKRGKTQTYSTGEQPGWELTRGPRGGRNRSMGATTPTSTGGRSYKYRDEGTRGVAGKVSTQAFGSDATASPRRSRRSIDWKRGSDKYKNIDRATIRKPETFESMEKSKDNNIYAIATAAAEGDEDKKEKIVRALKRDHKKLLKAFGVMKAPTSKENAEALNRELEWEKKHAAKRAKEERVKPHPVDPQLTQEGSTDELLAQRVAGEKDLYTSEEAIRSRPATKNQEASLRRHGFPELRDQRRGQRLVDESTGEHIRDLPGLPSVEESTDDYVKQYKKKQNQKVTSRLKEKYGDWNKPGQSAIQNLKKAHILKAFGVPISMPGGKQRTLPIIPTSEGGFFTKGTGGRHGLHPVEHRPKTVTEKRKHPHADGGEEHDSGARGATPAAFGMMKAGKKIKRLKDSAERIKELIRGGAGLDRSYRPGQKQHPKFAEEQAKLDEENPPFKEAALLYPAHQKEQQGGRKVKTRVGDSPGGFPT